MLLTLLTLLTPLAPFHTTFLRRLNEADLAYVSHGDHRFTV